ncbi:MAG: hypothetical protein E7315_06425 [Clostridiales bacterium]|nr:hypothetical protein [Clostridiales bacterium]
MPFVRLFKYIAFILIGVIVIGLVCVIAGFYAYDNVFISLVTNEGMRYRANVILQDYDTYSMYSLFTNNYMYNDFEVDNAVYDDFSIDSFTYRININSIKCSPWSTTAEVEIEERVLNVKGRYIKPDDEDLPDNEGGETDEEKKDPEIPVWTEGIYKLILQKTDGRWRIDSVELIEELESLQTPAPTLTPDITPEVTATPEVTPAA